MISTKWLMTFLSKKPIWTNRPWIAIHGLKPMGHRQRWTICQSDMDTIQAMDNKIFLVRPPNQSMFGHEPRNHPKASEIERTCDQWLMKNFSWLFKNEQDMQKLLRNRLTGFMTNTAPDADMDLLILSTDIWNYIFVMDDFLFDSDHVDLKRTEAIISEFSLILSNPTSPQPPTTYWTALFRQNLLPRMYQNWPRKYIRDFYVEFNKYLWVSLQQAHMDRGGYVDVDWDQLVIERYYIQGLGYVMSIIQPCFGVDILAGTATNDKCRKLVQLCCQFICFANDLYSFKKEILVEKIITNTIWVYKMSNQVSWHQAIDEVKIMADKCLIDATEIIEEMHRESNDPKVLKWLDQIVPIFQWFPNGYCEWAINQTGRYKEKFDECALTHFQPQLYQFAQNSRPTQQFCTIDEEEMFLAKVKQANIC